MGPDPKAPPPYSVELTLSAETSLDHYGKWQAFLIAAIDYLAYDPEPDGLNKRVAHANSGYSGNLLLEASPFWIVYQLVGPNRVIVISITPEPTRM